MPKHYDVTIEGDRIQWLGEKPKAQTLRAILIIEEEPSPSTQVKRTTPAHLIGKGKTLGDMEQSNGKSSRQRGVILTAIGYQKLYRAKMNWEIEQNTRRTLDILSEQTGLTTNTLSKIFSCSVVVDKRTMYACFSAFNLDLDDQDYHYNSSYDASNHK